ncbi:uncharacterized protein [Aquarana catesbeiana]|uniref:uncharacterized protein n=1 Tax=Aquarana catesbeiana TaxID=8400 RepID=UPI003CC9523C
MASADLRKELGCSICLKIFKDPVTLKCGHNFCLDCITHEFQTNSRIEGYVGRYKVCSCPECKENFYSLVGLIKNVNLRNMTERLFSKSPTASGTICTFCVESPTPAVQYCLHCEASLCDNHLTVHSKSVQHVLTDPITHLEIEKCSDHNKSLEYYCTEDSACICVYCHLIGEHKGHRSADKIKVTALREDLRTQPKDLEETRRVSTQDAEHSLPDSNLIQEQKHKMVSSEILHTEELFNKTDPLPDLQDSAIMSPDLKKDLECSICQNIFTDPVTLRCGHNFCCECLSRDLETHKVLEGVIFEMEYYFCPECKDRYSESDKPRWVSNITLHNMAKILLSQTKKSLTASRTICTYCVDSPTPAVQSCLHCEASLCDKHLKVHSKSAQHFLTDPITSLEMSKCSDHNKILKYYCTDDSAWICLYCCLIGAHKGHKTVTRGSWKINDATLKTWLT